MEKYKLKIFRPSINYKVFFGRQQHKRQNKHLSIKNCEALKILNKNFQKIELKEKIIINDSSEEEAPT